MKRNSIMFAVAGLIAVAAAITYAESLAEKDEAQFAKMYTGKYLYTNPDPAQGGGIKGEIMAPKGKIVGIFALPPHEPKFVYKAVMGGTADRPTFEFTGLPAAKYDLMICFEQEVYEGLTLNRYKNTLTADDMKAIEFIVNKSDPFFEKKIIHRISGITGKKKGKARAIVSEIRLGPVTDMANNVYAGAHKRNYKMFYLEDVGPGYQVARTRDVLSKFVDPGKEVPRWCYRSYLSSIRVTDSVKNLSALDLSVVGPTPDLPDPVDEVDPGDSIPVEDSK